MTTKFVVETQAPRTAPGTLPDVNAETYPFEQVQQYLDQTAFLNLFAVPDADHFEHASVLPDSPDDWFGLNGGYGLDLSSALHRFNSSIGPGMTLQPEIGEKLGHLRIRLLFGPNSTDWLPSHEPMPRLFDPWRAQRFATTELKITLGSETDGFRGYAVGRTYPFSIDGRSQVVVCAVGNLGTGHGSLSGLTGTIAFHGSLTSNLGFAGNVTLRIVDPGDAMRVKGKAIPKLSPINSSHQNELLRGQAATYIVMRGEKENKHVRTEYGRVSGPRLVSLITPAVMKAVTYGLRASKQGPPQADMNVGATFARLNATVSLDILAPPGTPESPNDFQTKNVYTFSDEQGREVGTITAEVETGKSFELTFPRAPGQVGMRYGGFGRIVSGSGCFDGARGTLIVNSAIGVAPHALSMLNVLRIVDPRGEFPAFDRKGSTTSRKDRREDNHQSHSAPGLRNHSGGQHETPRQATALPDINAETYPYAEVLIWLDQAAHFNMYSSPKRGKNPAIIAHRHPGAIVGVHVHETLHRFDTGVQAPVSPRLIANNRIGEEVGSFSHRWMVIPDDFPALPGRHPPSTPFDPTQSQRFVMLDGTCCFKDGKHGFFGFGTGRTYPKADGDPSSVIVGAVGNITRGFGKFDGCEGTYTYCGELCPSRGFTGNVICRVIDPRGVFNDPKARLPALTPARAIVPDATYILFRGQKQSAAVKTTYSFDVRGNVNGLNVEQELRLFSADFSVTPGIQSESRIGPVIGQMTAHVMFNILEPGAPGTGNSPIPFQSFNRYVFTDACGRSVGSFEVDGGEGRTFNMTLSEAPGQQALRFGVFGPIVRGTGVFEGLHGMMTDNSVVAVSPHAVSTLYVLRLADPQRRDVDLAIDTGVAITPRDSRKEPFALLIDQLERNKRRYINWRRSFYECADALSAFISENLNDRVQIGDFPGLRIDARQLKAAFRSPIGEFDGKTFERYGGRAKGTFRSYDMSTGKEVGEPSILYSVWGQKTRRVGDRYVKEITGSKERYFAPEALTDLANNNVDLLVNSYQPDTGVTSWVSMGQQGKRERTSFAYGLSHQDEVLWIVKDVSENGSAIENNVFMASHEWKGTQGAKTCYFMVGLFFELNVHRCTVKTFGSHFWKALYVEE